MFIQALEGIYIYLQCGLLESGYTLLHEIKDGLYLTVMKLTRVLINELSLKGVF